MGDLCSEFRVTLAQMPVDITERQDHDDDVHAPVGGIPEVREYLRRPLSYPRAPEPDAFLCLVDPAAQLFWEMVFVVQIDQGGVAAQRLPDFAGDRVAGWFLGEVEDFSRPDEVYLAGFQELLDSV